MMQAEKWQKDLAVYRNINTTFIIEGNVHDLQPFLYEDDGSCEPVSLSLYLHRYLSAVGYDPVVFYNRIDGFSNPYALDMTASFFRTTGTSVPSVLLTEYPAPEALSSAKNPPAACVLPGWRLSSVCSGCLFMLSWNGIRKKRGDSRHEKNTVYRISDPADLPGRGAAASTAAVQAHRRVAGDPGGTGTHVLHRRARAAAHTAHKRASGVILKRQAVCTKTSAHCIRNGRCRFWG